MSAAHRLAGEVGATDVNQRAQQRFTAGKRGHHQPSRGSHSSKIVHSGISYTCSNAEGRGGCGAGGAGPPGNVVQRDHRHAHDPARGPSGARPSAPSTATPSSTSTPGSPRRTTRTRSPTWRPRTPAPRRRRRTSPTCGTRSSRRSRAAPRRPTCRCPAARAATGTTPARSRASSTASTAGVAAAPGETDPPATGDGAPLPGEEVLLDGNELAEGKEFFALGTFDVSPDGDLLAYSADFAGDERFTLRVKDLRTGEVLADEVPDTFYGSAWSADGVDAVLPDRRRGLAAPPGLAAHRRRRPRPTTSWSTRRPTSGSGSASS